MITATNSRQTAASFLGGFVPRRLVMHAYVGADPIIYPWSAGANLLLQDMMDADADVSIVGDDVFAVDKPFDWNRPKVQS